MRTQSLSAVKAGITRLREKGGASPDSLYDLVNGYVTAARTIKSRPGSAIEHTLPAGTKGLVLFQGQFVVFSSEPLDPGDPDYYVEVLRHPDPAAALEDIRFAAPILGFLYVVARWSTGDIYHYYLERAEAWQAETVYYLGDVVQPVTPNGFTYKPHRLGEPEQLWEAGVEREIGDVVEPTTFNGFEYVVVEAYGSPPRSGDTEPTWAAEDGALVVEEADVDLAPPQQQQPPPSVPPRYGNPGGGWTPGNDTQMQAR